MSIKQGAELSVKEMPKVRTNMRKHKELFGLNLSADEKMAMDFVDKNKLDVLTVANSKTHAFMIQWLKKSIDAYKNQLVYIENINADATKGIIQGQDEILAMFETIAKYTNAEAK